MLFLICIVQVTRGQALEVDEVAPFVGAADPLDFDGAGDLDLLAGAVDDPAGLEGELLPADLLHQVVELLAGIYGLVLVDAAILRERCQVIIIQDARDDALGDDPVAPVVDYGGREDVEALTVQDLERPQPEQVVIRLREGRVIL